LSAAPPLERNKIGNRWLGPILAVYWLGAFSGTHLPGSALPTTPWGDKIDHLATYFGLGLLLCVWLALSRPWLKFAPLIAIAIALPYGVLDEITQPIVYRVADLGDWIADALGASAGVLVGTLIVYIHRRWKGRL